MGHLSAGEARVARQRPLEADVGTAAAGRTEREKQGQQPQPQREKQRSSVAQPCGLSAAAPSDWPTHLSFFPIITFAGQEEEEEGSHPRCRGYPRWSLPGSSVAISGSSSSSSSTATATKVAPLNLSLSLSFSHSLFASSAPAWLAGRQSQTAGDWGKPEQSWRLEQPQSCSTRQSPQVTCEARIPSAETTPAAGVNVVVVVDGNCILQYTHRQSPCSCLSDGEPLLPRHPPPTYGAVPPSPTIPRGPACGQEAGPPPSRRTRGLSVRCCTKACLGDEEEHTDRHLHRGPSCSRLTPVPLPRSPSGPWFGVGSLSGGRPGARVVKIWDRQRCPLLEEGDIIAKVNGADVRDLSPGEVESVLQEHTRTGDVILLVERKGHHSRRHTQENCTFRRENLLPDSSHNKRVSRDAPNAWGGPSGDTLAVTSFVGPEPRDVLVCPAHCSQRPRRPRPAGGAGDPVGSVDGPREEYGCCSSSTIATDGGGISKGASSLLPHQEEGLSHQEDSGLLARLSHTDVGGVFRQAGSRVRMKIRNRKDTGISSDMNTADIDVGECPRSPTYRLPQPQEVGQYSVELFRGPNGFGFSLRGGSEYNMDIYVLALMEGGPAQQCGKIQVSDQLVEINGESTSGMTHAQAVEHIRNGGSRIHLVLKRGNGFVPDYDREYSQSPAKTLQVPEAEDRVRHRHRRANPAGGPQYQGQSPCDGGGQETSPSGRQQLPKARPSGRLHHGSTKVQVEEEEDRERGWKQREPGKNSEGRDESSKLLSPRPSRKLRSDLVPGPWLVPSKERLSRALWGVCMGQGEEEEQKGDPGRGKSMEVKRRS